jgi:cation diffusion facilitator CzcD-associated flavoprotein CzcO
LEEGIDRGFCLLLRSEDVPKEETPVADLDVVVVGAGFAGIYAVHALRSAGLTVRAFEAGSGVGGTWFWNCYPGARCDVESKDYSYSFSPELEQEWSWSERYPAQPEVLRYLNHVADKFSLRPYIQLNTRVTAATWDAGAAEWVVTTDDGATVTARFFLSAVGCLSAYQVPSLPGLATFEGPWYHTSRWPTEGVDFTGKRVGLIGTGSTGIQIAPEIAAVAEHLTVFQRTANFAVPNRNAPIDSDWERSFKTTYRDYREHARRSRSSPLESALPGGLKTASDSYELDALVFATGFDALTGALLAMDIRGVDEVTLRGKWSTGPRTYLGLATPGFPNMFIVTGPGSPSVLSNMVLSIEQHVEWVRDCVRYLTAGGYAAVEATVAAEDTWMDHVTEVAYSTLFPLADSWYIGANIPGKPRVYTPYVGGCGPYRDRCDAVAAAGYEGFDLSVS